MSPDDLEALKTLDLSQVMLSGTIDSDTGTIGQIDAPGAHAKLQAVLLDRKVPRIDTVFFPDLDDIRNPLTGKNGPLFLPDSEWYGRIHFVSTISDVVTLLGNNVEAKKHSISFRVLENELPAEDDLVGREWLFEIVNEFLRDPHGSYLLLTAPPGFGKSAITKLLWQRLHQRDQLPPVDSSTVVEGEPVDSNGRWLEVAVALCVIKRGEADGPDRMVAKLSAQIRKSLRLSSHEPGPDATNATQLAGLLKEASGQLESHQRLVILWDGFDEAFGPEGRFSGMPLVELLPASLPSNVKIIVTTRPGTTIDSLSFLSSKQRVDLEKDHEGQRADIRKFLDQENERRRLQLSPEFLVRLADATEGVFAAARLFIIDPNLGEWQRDPSLLPRGLDGWLERQWQRLMKPLAPTTTETQYQPSQRPEPNVIQVVLGFLATLREQWSEDSLDRLFTALDTFSASEPASTVAGVLIADVGVQLSDVVSYASNLFCGPREGQSRQLPLRFFHSRFAEFIRQKITPRQRRDINRLLARFCHDRWRDKGQSFQTYALNNAVWHLLDAGSGDAGSFAWDEIEAILCDWRYIELKRDANELDSLRAEYSRALAEWPDPIEQKRRKDEKQRQQTLYQYTRDLVEHARDPDRVPLPAPPPLVEMESADEATDGPPGVWRPVEKVQAWSQMVAHNSANLAAADIPVFQTVYNAFDTGPVAEEIQTFLDAGGTYQRPWLRLRTRPRFSLHPACERTLEGHHGGVRSVAVTPDGSRAMSASADGTVKVWELASGQCLMTLKAHDGEVSELAVSSDGDRALSAGYDRTVKVWDLASGRCVQTIELPRWTASSVSMTPDGSRAVFGSGDGTLKVWDLANGQWLTTLEGHRDAHWAVMPNGCHAVSGNTDGTVKVWDLTSGQCLMTTLEGHRGWVTSVAVTPDGCRAMSGSIDGTVKVWDLTSGQCLHTLEGHGSVAMTPDGCRAMLGSNNGRVKVWNLVSGECLKTFENNDSSVSSVAMTSDGGRAVSGSADGTVKVWNLSSLQMFDGDNEGDKGRVESVAVTPDGARAVSGSADGTVKVWDLASGECLKTLDHDDRVRSVTTMSDRDKRSGNILDGYRNVRSVAVMPDGGGAVSAGDNGMVKLWDLASGRCLQTLVGHSGFVRSVAVTPDGTRAVSGNDNGTVKVWDLASGKRLKKLEGHLKKHEGHDVSVHSVAVMPDGCRAVSGSNDGTVKVWDLASGRCLMTLEEHHHLVSSVAVTPDGSRAVSGSWDKTVKVWDLASSKCVQTFEGHDDWVNSVAVMPDGCRAVSGSNDGTVKVWDLASGKCIAMRRFEPGSKCNAIAVYGRVIVTGTSCGKVEILTLELLGVDDTAFVTPTRVWHFDRRDELGRWDDTLTILCPFCGVRFPASHELCGQRISCGHCTASLQVNPFVCDLRDGLL